MHHRALSRGPAGRQLKNLTTYTVTGFMRTSACAGTHTIVPLRGCLRARLAYSSLERDTGGKVLAVPAGDSDCLRTANR